MKGFEIIVLENLVNCHSQIQGHLALGGIKCSELENVNLIENVKPECKSDKTRTRYRCNLKCLNSDKNAWPTKSLRCTVRTDGSYGWKPWNLYNSKTLCSKDYRIDCLSVFSGS